MRFARDTPLSERDLHPGKFYLRAAVGERQFNDLPVVYRENINVDPPLDRYPGDKPALSAAEIEDIVARLRTFTDGDMAPTQRLAGDALSQRIAWLGA